jgi:hypothetical protein
VHQAPATDGERPPATGGDLMRRKSGILEAKGGCFDCQGCKDYDNPMWTNRKNALALAAQHAKRTGHTTWAQQTIGVTYNPKDGD